MHFDIGTMLFGVLIGWVTAWLATWFSVISDRIQAETDKERREAAVKARAVAEFDEMRR